MYQRLTGKNNHRWIFGIGLMLTVLATGLFGLAIDQRDQARFRNAVQTSQDQIGTRLQTYVALLVATRSFYQAASPVTPERFRTYVLGLDVRTRYPGLQGIGVSRVIAAEERDRFVASMQREHPDFRIWPAGEREEYQPIVMLEPLDRRNRAALGFDMSAEPVRREAMRRARDSGRVAATGRVTLVQEIDANKQAGFNIYLPLYADGDGSASARGSFLGLIYCPIRAGDLFGGVLGDEGEPEVTFAAYAGGERRPEALLYGEPRALEREARFELNTSFNVAGATWTLAFRSTPAFEATSSRRLVPAIGLSGFVASLALLALGRSQSRARERAEASEAAARAERNNLQALFSAAPAAVAILRGPELRYELSNPMNQEMASGRELLGRTVTEALPEMEVQGLVKLVRQVYETGEPFFGNEVPLAVHTKDGPDRPLYLNGTYQPLRGPDGRIDGVMSFAYDVTELVTSRQRAEALAEDLQRAVSVRDEFLSIAGHELRTPLAALMLQVQSLQRQLDKAAYGEPHPKLVERVGKVGNHVNRLERLVSDLLDVSRIQGGHLRLQLEEMDLAALMAEVADRFEEPLARAGCSLRLPNAPVNTTGLWDRARLDQVITNLLSNAIKYGPGRPIEIFWSEDGERVTFAVRDHGIGIAPEHRDRIFGRFERAVSERNYGGLGLGLWISRQIVETMGGTIHLDSAPAQGSTFTVTLPRRPADTAARA